MTTTPTALVELFADRHIGPSAADVATMLSAVLGWPRSTT